MQRHREEIEELQRRVKQNERHLVENEWALLKDAGEPSGADSHDAVLRAQNLKMKALIEKLETLPRE